MQLFAQDTLREALGQITRTSTPKLKFRYLYIQKLAQFIMDFKATFINLLGSVLIGIFGGLVVWWFFAGIHMFDQGLKFSNKNLTERYLWKYSFILCALFLIVFITASLIYLGSLINSQEFLILSIIFAMISLIWVIFTLLKKSS